MLLVPLKFAVSLIRFYSSSIRFGNELAALVH